MLVLPFVRGAVGEVPAAAVAVAVSVALVLTHRRGVRASLPLAAAIAWIAALWVVLQLLPLPPAVLGALSPGTASILDWSLRPIGLYPAWRPLSLDPGATAFGVTTAMASALTLTASAAFGDSPRRRRFLLRAIALSGATAAGALLLDAAVTGNLLASSRLFVNPNHMAAYLELGALVALGLALSTRSTERLIWVVAFVVTSLEAVLTLSRGGLVALCLGVVLVATLRRHEEDERRVRARPRWLAPAAMGLGGGTLLIAGLLAFPALEEQLRTTRTAADEIKWTIWPRALSMIAQFPVLGIGKGAFATTFPQFQLEPVQLTFTHVENEWLQLPLDLGVPLGLALIVAFAWTWWKAATAARPSATDAGALAAVAAVALHNGFDFSLEFPGVLVPFCVLVGLLSRHAPGWRVRPRVIVALAAAGCGAACLGAWLSREHPPLERAPIDATSPESIVSAARDAAGWHPADFLPQSAAGSALAAAGRCEEALPWLRRAMLLAPHHPQAHRYAGRCLAVLGDRAAALPEYRLAVALGDGEALREASAFYPTTRDLLRMAADTPQGRLDVGLLLLEQRPADAVGPLRGAWEDYQEVRALPGLGQAFLRLERHEEALAVARTLEAGEYQTEEGFLIASQALDGRGDPDAAQAELRRGLARCPGSHRIIHGLVAWMVREGRLLEAQRLAEEMSAGTFAELAGKRELLASILRAQGRFTEALGQAEAASRAAPTSAGVAFLVADLAEQVSEYERAVSALTHARTLPGVDAGAIDRRIAELRSKESAAKAATMEKP